MHLGVNELLLSWHARDKDVWGQDPRVYLWMGEQILAAGEAILAYSDGIIDAQNADGEAYECERLRDAGYLLSEDVDRTVRVHRDRAAPVFQQLSDHDCNVLCDVAYARLRKEAEKDTKAKAPLARRDYAVYEALNLLKGLSILQQRNS